MTPSRVITWLHLSDFHFKANATWEQNVVLTALKRDVLSKLREEGLRPDLVFVTGDIAYSGKGEEYASAGHFFEDVARTTDTVSLSSWFVVPGNHDVNRNAIKRFAKRRALEMQDVAEVNDILTDADTLRLFTMRQQEFFQFTSTFLGASRAWTDVAPWKVEAPLSVHGLNVAVLGLNSAWAAEGDGEDQGRIFLGEFQARRALDEADSHAPDLKIALAHHPLDWLRSFDKERVAALLFGAGGVHFFLRGHLHSGRIAQQDSPDAHCIELAAGACWQDSKYPHGVTVVRLDTREGRAQVHLWRYSSEGRGFWKRDNFLYENLQVGLWEFKLPKRWGFVQPASFGPHPAPSGAGSAFSIAPPTTAGASSAVELTDVEIFRGRDWEEQSVEFMMKVYNIYISQHASQKFHYGKVSYENVAYSTLKEDDPGYDAFDVVTITSQFRPLPGQPLYCHAMSVSRGGTSPRLWSSSDLTERWWVCTDPDGKSVNATALPAINPDNRQQWLVLFFTPPLVYQGDDRMYTLRLRDRLKGTLEELVRTKQDTVGMGFKRAAGSIPLAEIVVYLPKHLAASITGNRPPGTGELLPPTEFRVSYTQPSGFVPLGWRGRDLDQDAVFSVDIGI